MGFVQKSNIMAFLAFGVLYMHVVKASPSAGLESKSSDSVAAAVSSLTSENSTRADHGLQAESRRLSGATCKVNEYRTSVIAWSCEGDSGSMSGSNWNKGVRK